MNYFTLRRGDRREKQMNYFRQRRRERRENENNCFTQRRRERRVSKTEFILRVLRVSACQLKIMK